MLPFLRQCSNCVAAVALADCGKRELLAVGVVCLYGLEGAVVALFGIFTLSFGSCRVQNHLFDRRGLSTMRVLLASIRVSQLHPGVLLSISQFAGTAPDYTPGVL